MVWNHRVIVYCVVMIFFPVIKKSMLKLPKINQLVKILLKKEVMGTFDMDKYIGPYIRHKMSLFKDLCVIMFLYYGLPSLRGSCVSHSRSNWSLCSGWPEASDVKQESPWTSRWRLALKIRKFQTNKTTSGWWDVPSSIEIFIFHFRVCFTLQSTNTAVLQ